MGIRVGEVITLLELRGFVVDSELEFSDNVLDYYPSVINSAVNHVTKEQFEFKGLSNELLKDTASEELYERLKTMLFD